MRTYGGYGKATIVKNMLSYMENEGYDENKARELAKKLARKHFIRKFPDKPMPDHMLEVKYE